MARFSLRGRVVAALAGAVATIALAPVALVANAPSASAATSQFQGLNWARWGDNYTGSPLILAGLSSTDSYSTVQAKADAIYAGFQGNLGANTVRLPINTYTAGRPAAAASPTPLPSTPCGTPSWPSTPQTPWCTSSR